MRSNLLNQINFGGYMKKSIPLTLFLLSFSGLTQAAAANYLQLRNGVAYQVNQESPFSGDFEQKYDNGQYAIKITYKNGKENGTATKWYYNGQKESEGNYENGQANGLFTKWFPNGQKSEQLSFKNDKQDGNDIHWYFNGQKRSMAKYTNGKHSDGVATAWYEDGEKYLEVTYKKGQEISREYWSMKPAKS